MASIRINIATNLVAAAWTAGLTAAITPVQINLLGIEAYGVIGLIATLQIVFSAFDLGLSSTLTREIASGASKGRHASLDLIRTASTVYWMFAGVLGIGLALCAGLIARHWFNAQTMDTQDLVGALYLIIVFLALRWPVALYTGILAGLQRMEIINGIKIATTTLRNVGGIVVIALWRDVGFFLWWLAVNALIEVLVFYLVSRRVYGAGPFGFGISVPALKAVWKFSLSMSAISILALLISQFDRIVTSKLLTLQEFGYYSLAYNTAAVAMIATTAVSSAMLPSFAAAQGIENSQLLIGRYFRGTKTILFILGIATFPLIFFGDLILRLWIGQAAATGAGTIMAILALGFWLSAAFSNPYNLAVAVGRPDLPLKISLFSALPYGAVLVFLVMRWGGRGAAVAWLLLTIGYIFTLVPVVHRKLLGIPTLPWFTNTLLPFALLGVVAFGIPRFLLDRLAVSRGDTLAALIGLGVSVFAYLLCGYWLLGREIREQLLRIVKIKGGP